MFCFKVVGPRLKAFVHSSCLSLPAIALMAAFALGVSQPAGAQAAPDAAAPARAEGAQGAQTHDGPARVVVGAYVTQVKSVDLKKDEFEIVFWLWFRWSAPELKPLESFEVIDGTIEAKDNIVERTFPDGTRYAALKVTAVIKKYYDVSRFPLDNHDLIIAVEDGEYEDGDVVFVSDAENSSVDPAVQIPGWRVAGSTTRIATSEYHSNYGDTSLPTGNSSRYSRFDFILRAERTGWGYFFKLFWGTYLSVLIAFLAFFVRPNDLDPRFGLGVGAIFAAMANTYVISGSLPDTQGMTMADLISAVAILFIFLSLALSAASLKQWNAGREGRALRMDQIGLYVLLGLYIGANVLVVICC